MWIWFGLSALALIGELASGTFYLLLVALGLAAGGLAAWGGLALGAQLLASVVVAMLGLLLLRRTRVLKKREVDAAGNADVNLDVGQAVEVESWTPDGRSRVWYRGAHWDAQLAAGQPAAAGSHSITAVQGTRLILTPRTRPAA